MSKFVIMLDGERFFSGGYGIGRVSYCESEGWAFKFGTKEEAFNKIEEISIRTYDYDGAPVDPSRIGVYEMKFIKVEKGE